MTGSELAEVLKEEILAAELLGYEIEEYATFIFMTKSDEEFYSVFTIGDMFLIRDRNGKKIRNRSIEELKKAIVDFL